MLLYDMCHILYMSCVYNKIRKLIYTDRGTDTHIYTKTPNPQNWK